jgi:hypothetical protein
VERRAVSRRPAARSDANAWVFLVGAAGDEDADPKTSGVAGAVDAEEDMNELMTVFRRHNDGTVTDVFEDACVWIRDDREITVQAFAADGSELDITRCYQIPRIIGIIVVPDSPGQLRTFGGMCGAFTTEPQVDRLVFTHADGRQAYVTRADFGL